MADVFISYSSKDRALTEVLAKVLEERGFSVWWDTSIVAGDQFSSVIMKELGEARAVIVVWTENSVKSEWVCSEARRANTAGKLIPVRHNAIQIDDIPPPYDVIHTEVVTSIDRIFAALKNRNIQPSAASRDATEQAAMVLAGMAQRLRDRGHNSLSVAQFIIRLVFCFFAESAGLIKARLFTKMLESCRADARKFERRAKELFAAMRAGGEVNWEQVEHFNGGLFNDDSALPVTQEDIDNLLSLVPRNWSNIDPALMGTLFERGLDPQKRSQLGKHYTDPDMINLILEPTLKEPLLREWEAVKTQIAQLMDQSGKCRSKSEKTKLFKDASKLRSAFVERLNKFRVLDPACGSGNFLYLALKVLKDLELRVNRESEMHGLPPVFPSVGPECVRGIEINGFAAELARVSVWIGEIQWMRDHGFSPTTPILRNLSIIEQHDALLNIDGTEHAWPDADVIIGNPPFLGGKLLRKSLGDAAVDAMFLSHKNAVPAESDLVCYWFARAWSLIKAGKTKRAGLLATNSIRGGANRKQLDEISKEGRIFDAWSDEAWIVEGADVRVSIVCFDAGKEETVIRLDGKPVERINSDLTSGAFDLTKAERLKENAGVAFMGDTKGGAFDVPGELAREWLLLTNANGRPNSNVLRPWINGLDITRRQSDKWIIDFGWTMTEAEASLYEVPFSYILERVKPAREKNNRELYTKFWWRHAEPRPGMWAAIEDSRRYIATPRVSKHRVFVWCTYPTIPDSQVIITARNDDVTLGVLCSRCHEVWSLALCSWLGVGNDPRYTPSTTFETFPFPEGFTPNLSAANFLTVPNAVEIATAARHLIELRGAWLNPPELVRRKSEVVPGYPDRVLPINDEAAAILKRRTLTNLYNAKPPWLVEAHAALDKAVNAAYGWLGDVTDDQILESLFALNQERANAGR